MDYIKFKLKPLKEISDIVGSAESIFLVACKKCFLEFVDEDHEEYDELIKFLSDSGRKVQGCRKLDFLCNEYLTSKVIAQINFSNTDAIGVISCGIGAQFIFELLQSKPVYTLSDSIFTAYHGFALSEKRCYACARCYLNITGGFCPIVDCSKSLVNGPCGGSKNGKCEVKFPDGNKRDCVWEKIVKATNLETSVQFRNYSKPEPDFVNSKIKENISRRREGFFGGLYPLENKHITEDKPIEKLPEPEVVVIPLLQHTGIICSPLVNKGDRVKLGQKIGDSSEVFSAAVHSSVSGEVVAIEERPYPIGGKKVLSVVIKNDFKNTPDDSIIPLQSFESSSVDELLQLIRDKGIVGLGGAMFPTHIKLTPPRRVDTLIINGCECEPYLTCDYRMMIEHTEEILLGIVVLAKILCVSKIISAIEDNKPEAIKKMKDLKCKIDKEIDVVSLKTKYPQGAERMLIKRVLGREVPIGGLPFDVGVVVQNVTTAFAVWEAIVKGLPLIERVITVSGEDCTKPGNYKVKIGTPLKDIIDFCFTTEQLQPGSYFLKMGGPMMGITQENLEAPVVKGTTGVVVHLKPFIEYDKTRSCIKCGRCVDVCPMELYPLYFAFCFQKNKLQESDEYNIKLCIECGCCEYICSSKIPLVSIIKETKRQLC